MMIGIMSAMKEEIDSLIEAIELIEEREIGSRKYYRGLLWGKECVIVFSHWGKVASSSTVTTLINQFKVTSVLFTGVAGAVQDSLNIGDVVVGGKLVQHDMDARPIFKQFEIPLKDTIFVETDENLRKGLYQATSAFLSANSISDKLKEEFQLHDPKNVLGDIASGDKFVSKASDTDFIRENLPEVVCVEMEGAAVAQVCADYKVPFGIIRTISDKANVHSEMDFLKFIKEVASRYSIGIIKNYLKDNGQ